MEKKTGGWMGGRERGREGGKEERWMDRCVGRGRVGEGGKES